MTGTDAWAIEINRRRERPVRSLLCESPSLLLTKCFITRHGQRAQPQWSGVSPLYLLPPPLHVLNIIVGRLPFCGLAGERMDEEYAKPAGFP